MKKVIYAISAIALIVFGATSCQKNLVDASTTGKLTLTASVEQPSDADTKSYLDGALVKWHAGDAIKVFDEDGGYTKMETQDEGTTSAVFMEVGTVEDGTKSANFDETKIKCAIYPYSAESAYSDNKISYDFPEVQTYVANSFAPGANVAVAKLTPESNIASFTNVCGMLKLVLKGNGFIKKITIKSNNSSNEKLCGPATIAMDADKPVLAVNSTGEEVISLEVPKVLLTSDVTEFFIAVPVGCFGDVTNGGFVATLNNDPTLTYTTTKKENIILRSIVREMPAQTYRAYPIPTEYTIVDYVGGSSSILDTGVKCDKPLSLSVKFYIDSEDIGNTSFGFWGTSAPANDLVGLYSFIFQNKLYVQNFNENKQDKSLGNAETLCMKGEHEAYYDTQGVTWDGTFTEWLQSPNGITDNDFVLFGARQKNCKLVYFQECKITKSETGTLEFWGVAAKRISDGKLGIFDMVGEQFLTTDTMKQLTL